MADGFLFWQLLPARLLHVAYHPLKIVSRIIAIGNKLLVVRYRNVSEHQH